MADHRAAVDGDVQRREVVVEHFVQREAAVAVAGLAGALYDGFGSYGPSFAVAMAASSFGILCIWMAAPRKVRAVAGRIGRN